MTLSENPCHKVESAILKDSLGYVASAAEQQCIPKEDMLKKMVQEAIRARDWDMSSFFENLVVSPISVQEITALFHVANLSQRQYQMCRNLLVRYGINAFPPRNDIDSYKKTLYPTVRVEPLSASVGVKELFDSTLFDIIDNELLSQSIGEWYWRNSLFSEESGFAKRQLAAHWSGKQSYLKYRVSQKMQQIKKILTQAVSNKKSNNHFSRTLQ